MSSQKFPNEFKDIFKVTQLFDFKDDECGEGGAVRRARQSRGDARADGGDGQEDQRPAPVHRRGPQQCQAGELSRV